MLVGVKNTAVDKSIVQFIRKICEGFVDNDPYTFFLSPFYQAQQIGFWNIIAAWIVGVDKDKVLDIFIIKELDQVIGSIRIIVIIRNKIDRVNSAVTIWIFFKRGSDKAHLSVEKSHKALYKLCRAVADQDVLVRNSEVFCRQKAVYPHSAWIFGKKRIEIGS